MSAGRGARLPRARALRLCALDFISAAAAYGGCSRAAPWPLLGNTLLLSPQAQRLILQRPHPLPPFSLWQAPQAPAADHTTDHTTSPLSAYLAYTPIIISNLLAGTALSNNSTVAASKGSNDLRPVALAIVPYTLAAVCSYLVAHSAQRRDEQFWHVSCCLLAAGIILALFPPLAKAAVAAGFLSLSVSLAIGASANGPATALVSRLCRGREQVLVSLSPSPLPCMHAFAFPACVCMLAALPATAHV